MLIQRNDKTPKTIRDIPAMMQDMRTALARGETAESIKCALLNSLSNGQTFTNKALVAIANRNPLTGQLRRDIQEMVIKLTMPHPESALNWIRNLEITSPTGTMERKNAMRGFTPEQLVAIHNFLAQESIKSNRISDKDRIIMKELVDVINEGKVGFRIIYSKTIGLPKNPTYTVQHSGDMAQSVPGTEIKIIELRK